MFKHVLMMSLAIAVGLAVAKMFGGGLSGITSLFTPKTIATS